MRLAFLGTPAFALPTFDALLEADHEIAAVYTRAPKPAGRRGLETIPSPVHANAVPRGIPVLTPRTLRDDDAVPTLRELGVSLGIVVAYGLLLPQEILDVPTHGFLNLHPSILPRWRGAAPIQRPILAGDTETAAAIMRTEAGLDTGPVAIEDRVPIPPEATAGEMHDVLAAHGARLMVEAVARLAGGTLAFRPQSENGVLYATKIDKAEARIDWHAPAARVHNLIRGLSPFPGAFFEADFGKGMERIKVLRARRAEGAGPAGTLLDAALTIACGDGAVQLVEIQRAGRAPMAADAFLRGTPVPAGGRV